MSCPILLFYLSLYPLLKLKPMIKSNYIRFCGILLISFVLNTQISKGQQKEVLVLKGNVLTPVPANSVNQTSTAKHDTGKHLKKAAPVVAKAPAAQPKPKPAPVVAKVPAPQPKPKPAPVVAKAPAQQPKAKPVPVVAAKQGPVLPSIDYVKRVQTVHNLVCKKIPQTVIDSIGEINHDLLDSIRHEIARHHDKDSINFLKTALSNGLNDSLTLVNINTLVNNSSAAAEQTTGSVKTYCIDLATQAPMDSVKVSIFSHDSLVATSFSDNTGFCKIGGLNTGEYSLSFSKVIIHHFPTDG